MQGARVYIHRKQYNFPINTHLAHEILADNIKLLLSVKFDCDLPVIYEIWHLIHLCVYAIMCCSWTVIAGVFICIYFIYNQFISYTVMPGHINLKHSTYCDMLGKLFPTGKESSLAITLVNS